MIYRKGVTGFIAKSNSESQGLVPVQTVRAPKHPENTGAHIHVHPSGRFLYGSNRGYDSLVIYQIEQDTGKLAYVGYQPTLGQTPRNVTIDPTGDWLLVANQDSDNIVLTIEQRTGTLAANGQGLEVASSGVRPDGRLPELSNGLMLVWETDIVRNHRLPTRQRGCDHRVYPSESFRCGSLPAFSQTRLLFWS